jgi:hypothetical protein
MPLINVFFGVANFYSNKISATTFDIDQRTKGSRAGLLLGTESLGDVRFTVRNSANGSVRRLAPQGCGESCRKHLVYGQGKDDTIQATSAICMMPGLPEM